MSLESGKNTMDSLKARNIPPALRKQMESEAKPETPAPMVQLSAEEWKNLTELIDRLERAWLHMSLQKIDMAEATNGYKKEMAKAAQEQTEASKKAIEKLTKEAVEQVGRASDRASRVIDRQIWRDEAVWWIRLALTAIPTILVLLLWARVGLGI